MTISIPINPFKFEILNEKGDVIAKTVTRWTADCLLDGILSRIPNAACTIRERTYEDIWREDVSR